jgi:hypothetical protein
MENIVIISAITNLHVTWYFVKFIFMASELILIFEFYQVAK